MYFLFMNVEIMNLNVFVPIEFFSVSALEIFLHNIAGHFTIEYMYLCISIKSKIKYLKQGEYET